MTTCVWLNGEDLSCYSNKIESVSLRKCPHDHWLTNKAYLRTTTVTNIYQSFTCKMTTKINWYRYRTNYVTVILCIQRHWRQYLPNSLLMGGNELATIIKFPQHHSVSQLKWRQNHNSFKYKYGFGLVNSANNTALPAFAAERRAAVPLMLGARRCRSISPARTAPSSKLTARRCCGHMTGQTYGRRDGLDRYIDPAPHRLLGGHCQ